MKLIHLGSRPMFILPLSELARGEGKTPCNSGAEREAGPSTPHPFLGLVLSSWHMVSLAGAVYRARCVQASFARGQVQPSLPPNPALDQRGLLPICKVGAEGRAQGECCKAEKLQLCSLHTIPFAGRYSDSLLLPSTGDK